MKSKSILKESIFFTLILYFVASTMPENILYASDGKQFVVIYQRNHVNVYKKHLQNWQAIQNIEIQTVVHQIKLNQDTLAIIDGRNMLWIFQNSPEGFIMLFKKEIPPLKEFEISQKRIIGLTKGEQIYVFSIEQNKYLQTFPTLEKISNIKICPNQRSLLSSSNSIFLFSIENDPLLEKKYINENGKRIKSLETNKDCSKIFILSDDRTLNIFRSEEGELTLTKNIMVKKDMFNLKTNSEGSLVTAESINEIYAYQIMKGQLSLIKTIEKKAGEKVEAIYEKSLLINAGKETFFMEIVGEKREKIQQKSIVERILVDEVTSEFEKKYDLQFSDPQILADYANVKAIKAQKNQIVLGKDGKFILLAYDGSSFVEKYSIQAPSTTIESVQLNIERKWIFKGDNESKIHVYADEGTGYQEKQVIEILSGESINEIDVNSNGYLIAKDIKNSYIFSFDNQTFVNVQNMTFTSRGIKMCEDSSFLSEKKNKLNFYTSTNQSYSKESSSALNDQFQSGVYLSATDDCRVILVSTDQFPDSSENPKFEIHMKKQNNKISKFVEKNSLDLGDSRKSSINPDGDMFVLPGEKGVDVWKFDEEYDDYLFVHRFDRSKSSIVRSSAVITNNFIIYDGRESGNENALYISHYSWFNTSTPKNETSVTKVNTTISAFRNSFTLFHEFLDMKFYKNQLLTISKYYGFYTLGYNSQNTYKQHIQSYFLSCLDFDENSNILVLGTYQNKAHAYLKKKLRYSIFQTIQTSSPIMDLDLNSKGDLLLGGMNGDLSLFHLNQSAFALNNITIQEGGRVYGTKMCSDGRFLALIENMGWFYFKAFSAAGVKTFTYQLQEFVEAQFEASDDCQKVVIVSTLYMKIEVFNRNGGQYSLFRMINEEYPLTSLSMNPDGDVFIVSRQSQKQVALYRYDDCKTQYFLDEVFQIPGGSDIQISAMSEKYIAVGSRHDSLHLFDYSYSTQVCRPFENKRIEEITDLDSVDRYRAIKSVSISGQMVAFISQYSCILLYTIGEPLELMRLFPDDLYISDLKLQASLETLVAGNLEKSVLVFKNGSFGSFGSFNYNLEERIPTASQVLHVDLSKENRLLVGMMNGDLAEFSSNGQSFLTASPSNITHAGGRVYGVKMCLGGRKLALLELNGMFKLLVYAPDNTLIQELTEEFHEQLIEVYLAASSDCTFVAVSGITMKKVEIFIKSEDSASAYLRHKTLDVGEPLSEVAIDEKADIVVVASITREYSFVYYFTSCFDDYTLHDKIYSGAHDEAVAISEKFIAHGNQDGTLKVSSYAWEYNTSCPAIEQPLSARTTKTFSAPSLQDNALQTLYDADSAESYEHAEGSEENMTLSSPSPFENSLQTEEGPSTGLVFLIIFASLSFFANVLLIYFLMKGKSSRAQLASKLSSVSETSKSVQNIIN